MKLSKGFTIIELIVVMAVFLFIIGAAIGIFLSIVQNQKKVLADQEFLNQISYVQEYMSKALRMAKTAVTSSDTDCLPLGYIYFLTRSNAGFYQGIKFINQSDNNICQEFFLDADGVLKEIKGGGSPVALTSTNLQIKSARFSINGSNGSTFASASGGCSGTTQCGAWYKDAVQPRVTILLNVSISGDSSIRTVQTTVSQRNLNVNNGQR
jgi:prepilin-type N-terminal cleavage/methylation domain-containing protein